MHGLDASISVQLHWRHLADKTRNKLVFQLYHWLLGLLFIPKCLIHLPPSFCSTVIVSHLFRLVIQSTCLVCPCSVWCQLICIYTSLLIILVTLVGFFFNIKRVAELLPSSLVVIFLLYLCIKTLKYYNTKRKKTTLMILPFSLKKKEMSSLPYCPVEPLKMSVVWQYFCEVELNC